MGVGASRVRDLFERATAPAIIFISVIVLAATNRPDVLDPALLRRGCFDRQVMVDLPDWRGREVALRLHTRASGGPITLHRSAIAAGIDRQA